MESTERYTRMAIFAAGGLTGFLAIFLPAFKTVYGKPPVDFSESLLWGVVIGIPIGLVAGLLIVRSLILARYRSPGTIAAWVLLSLVFSRVGSFFGFGSFGLNKHPLEVPAQTLLAASFIFGLLMQIPTGRAMPATADAPSQGASNSCLSTGFVTLGGTCVALGAVSFSLSLGSTELFVWAFGGLLLGGLGIVLAISGWLLRLR